MTAGSHEYYMPREVTAGMFALKSGGRGGFVTCRYMDSGWLKTATFKRLTGGYLPSQQKDPETQLKKAVCNKAATFENEPTAGFRVTGRVENVYGYRTGEYTAGGGDFIMEDPRGFSVALRPADFAKLVSEPGSRLENGELAGRYAYAWTVASGEKRMTLLLEGTPAFDDAARCREEFEAEKASREKTSCVGRREFVVGRAYRAVKALQGDWIYAGVRDTYSGECHLRAFDAGGYDVGAAIENEKDWAVVGEYARLKTSVGRMVFLSAKPDSRRPYVARRDTSGVFASEAPLPSRFRFGDSSGAPTVESLEKNIASNPAFQRVDFAKFYASGAKEEPMSPDLFVTLAGNYEEREKLVDFPFDRTYGYFVVKCGRNAMIGGFAGKWAKVVKYRSDTRGNAETWRITNLDEVLAHPVAGSGCWSGSCGNGLVEGHWSAQQLYTILQPVVPAMSFENGNRVPQRAAMRFVPHDVRSAAQRIY